MDDTEDDNDNNGDNGDNNDTEGGEEDETTTASLGEEKSMTGISFMSHDWTSRGEVPVPVPVIVPRIVPKQNHTMMMMMKEDHSDDHDDKSMIMMKMEQYTKDIKSNLDLGIKDIKFQNQRNHEKGKVFLSLMSSF
jgi:hypothetical protein